MNAQHLRPGLCVAQHSAVLWCMPVYVRRWLFFSKREIVGWGMRAATKKRENHCKGKKAGGRGWGAGAKKNKEGGREEGVRVWTKRAVTSLGEEGPGGDERKETGFASARTKRGSVFSDENPDEGKTTKEKNTWGGGGQKLVGAQSRPSRCACLNMPKDGNEWWVYFVRVCARVA